ncbi:hypothetical protein KM043_014673 [Ampulex compressa]|nr:hypothetical protein KM043_014673 [Ampulex compressa]
MMSVVDKIHHYQRNIEKCSDNEDRMLHCISKLSNLPVTVQHLQETGVGRTVNALRKYDGGVGDAAKALVAKWKAMVANEESSDGEDEDEACVPDAPESYSDGHESPKLEDVEANDATPSRYKNEESKHVHRHKVEKSEVAHNSKHMPKQESKSKSSDSSSNALEKEKKQDRSKHMHKHESRTEKKSSRESKDGKHISRKEEAHSSKHHNHNKVDVLEKSSAKLLDTSKTNKVMKNDAEHYKKRKIDSSSSMKKENKRRKNSDCESDEANFHASSSFDKHNDVPSSSIKIKEEPKDKDITGKIDVKSEKKHMHEKGKSSSSNKSKSDISSSKLKDVDEKQKQLSHKRDESRKDESHHSNKEGSESKNHYSSSSGKNNAKSKDKIKKKEHKDEKGKGSRSSGESKDSKHGSKESKETVRIKQEINGDEGIDCNSGASFAEALGMCTVAQPTKKRSNNSPIVAPAKVIKTEPNSSATVNNKKPSSSKIEVTSDGLQPPSLLAPNVKLEPLSVDLASTLPEISPNYKPLPYINPMHRKEEDKALTDVIYVKNQRTKVYSGNKCGYTSVPSLYEMCIRVLIENIDALEFTGGVPYDIIKPVLERATPDQLFMLEHYNPYLIEDTDSLWQFHCNREFRNKQREEMETWREMYMRCLDEREAKLKTLTANIKQSIDKSLPVRSTKLAYVDNVVKPPRNVLKKQAKYGTANSVPTSASNLKKKLISGGGPSSATNISVPPPPMSRAKPTSSGVVKKTKAPLMAKALQLIKGRYKR